MILNTKYCSVLSETQKINTDNFLELIDDIII